MEAKSNVFEKGKKALTPLFGISGYLKKSRIEKELLELVDFRVSQLNGCAYCLDMHAKELRAMGETEQRLYGLSAWREAPYYTARERAALQWAEAITKVQVTDDVHRIARAEFSDEELIDLTLGVTAINTWNRFNLVFENTPGTYQVGMSG